MTYLVSFSENDLDLVREALDIAERQSWFLSDRGEKFHRMYTELGELKARQDAA